MELKRYRQKKGFTLIEVLTAVAILSIVGVALLQMNIKNQKISEYIDKKTKLAQISSILGYHHTKDYTKLEKSIYDFIKNDYEIDNTEIKKSLDSYSVYYDEIKVKKIEFGESNESEEEAQTQTLDIMQAIGKKDDKTASVYFLEF